ncbi:MAG: cell division protein FtsH [Candidatus Omnitrophica bacterium CG11_big_fil_rev_8_21_14_0_20_41_12]|nr:MAG: cell division protein FtsH [Candidatus Omnitrophica bacterium CG11_big_fil_rev_8_21_14_0_20_41_12]
MNWKKFKFYAKLHWLKVVLITFLVALTISLIILVIVGMRAWNEAESYLRQSQLAMIPLQLYLQIIMALIFGFVYTFLMYWLYFKRGASSFSQTSKKSVSGGDIGVTWNDVIGMDEAKEEALEVVKLITDRVSLQRIGGKILKGILMLGPPGCGKTYLAKAIATETKLPFISMSGSEFVEMFVGVGAGRVRSLFKKAQQLAELEGGCIIFIDEIDAIGAQRSMDRGFGGTTEHNTTLNQLLVEMDGLKDKDHNIILIGATNAPETYLDQALLRPGRFDRKIIVDKPNLDDRAKLFTYYLKNIKYNAENVKIDRLARITVGQTPADIANIVHEAALITIRNQSSLVSMQEIDEARERIALGIKRRVKLSEKEKWQTAYHEAGHAIVTYLLAPSKDVFKITITPRGPTGGATWIPEREDTFIEDSNQILSKIKISLGSYAAEKIKYNATTSGVYGDFSSAMHHAHNMVWVCGMGKSGLLGNWEIVNKISEDTKAKLDADVQDILNTCLIEITALLKKEEPLMDRLAKELVAKSELNYDEIEAIFKEFGKSRP